MPINRRRFLALAAAPLARAHGVDLPATTGPPRRGAVATVNPCATKAAVETLEDGGNAVDAAIAAALMLGVVDGHNSGLGGGLFLLVRHPDSTIHAIDGRECAPAAATRDMFVRDGTADPRLSRDGPLAVAVPGALAALAHVAGMFGRLPMARALRRAADVAAEGFVPDRIYNARLRATAHELRQFPASANVYLRPQDDGRLRLPDLAQSYRAIAEQGVDWFYRGPFATLTDAWMKEIGGLLTADDFAAYRAKLRRPVRTTYRDHEIVGFPPPSSGGVHVAQILHILESCDLRAMADESADFIHTVAEAMKLAFADRAYWLGDSDFADVPRGLLAREYAAAMAKQIDPQRANPAVSHGTPPAASTDIFEKHTTHFSVADGEGWWVACTATINTSFGSKVVVPGTGIVLNNEMDDFSAQPGIPNAFDLVGAEANAIAPRKRPLSSMSPTIVLKGGQPILAAGAAGGPTIISQVVLAILRTVDFGRDCRGALAGARFHHQWKPDRLLIERNISEEVRADLAGRGHAVDDTGSIGAAQAVGRDESGALSAAHDPRVPGAASAW